jgi:hypothetical protein
MHLIQILLPLYDNDGQPQPRALFDAVRAELTEQFGGLTAYTRAPAEGLWEEGPAPVRRDEIVLLEVMVDSLDRPWWRRYRHSLEQRFRQEQVVVRAQQIELL